VAWKCARWRQEEWLPAAAEASRVRAERRAAIFLVVLRAELDVPQEAEPVARARAAWARLVSVRAVRRVTEVFVESLKAAQESLAASL
jgi:hypothetical protein